VPVFISSVMCSYQTMQFCLNDRVLKLLCAAIKSKNTAVVNVITTKQAKQVANQLVCKNERPSRNNECYCDRHVMTKLIHAVSKIYTLHNDIDKHNNCIHPKQEDTKLCRIPQKAT
jgi:hypothetical protein